MSKSDSTMIKFLHTKKDIFVKKAEESRLLLHNYLHSIPAKYVGIHKTKEYKRVKQLGF